LGNQSKTHYLEYKKENDENKFATSSIETTEIQKTENCSQNTSRIFNSSTPKYVSTIRTESLKNGTENCTEFTTQSIGALNSTTDGKPFKDHLTTIIPDDKINCTDSPMLGEVHEVILSPETKDENNSSDVKSTTLNYSVSNITLNPPNNPYKPCESRNELILLVENDINLKVFLNSKGIIEKTLLLNNKTDISITNGTMDDIFDEYEIINNDSAMN
jgi:hypothetical protein